MELKRLCSKCKTVKQGDCPIFLAAAAEEKDFGIRANRVDALIFSVVEACGCEHHE